ncbi:hypothetical protein LINGRAHAP2_LOCUS32692 [Linum grandiflorum]
MLAFPPTRYSVFRTIEGVRVCKQEAETPFPGGVDVKGLFCSSAVFDARWLNYFRLELRNRFQAQRYAGKKKQLIWYLAQLGSTDSIHPSSSSETIQVSSKAPLAVNSLGCILNLNNTRSLIRHHSISFPSISRSHKLAAYPFKKRVGCVICAEANKQGEVVRGVQGKVEATLVFGCAIGLGIILVMRKNGGIAMAGPRQLYQKAPQSPAVAGYPLGGKAAIKSLLDVPKQMASTKAEPFQRKFELPYSPSMAEVNNIKMHAVRLMAEGQAESSVTFLREAYVVYKKRNDNEPAYNVGMVLVEILMCQGKYKEALECNCLNDNQRLPSDGRFPLYKAIICTMLDYKVEARKWWEQYIEAVDQGIELP